MIHFPIPELDVVNEALARLGEMGIASFDENTKTAENAKLIYPSQRDRIYHAWQWVFARTTSSLVRLVPVPVNGWQYGFTLPAIAIGNPVRVLSSPRAPEMPLREFAIEGGVLYADTDQVWATHISRIDPTLWPATFREAVVLAAMAALCVPVTQHLELAQDLRIQAFGAPQDQGRGGAVGIAINRDFSGAAQPANLYEDDPLTSARWQ
jgi:hypothetical protein